MHAIFRHIYMHAIFRHIYMDQIMPYLKRKKYKAGYITKYDHKRPTKNAVFTNSEFRAMGRIEQEYSLKMNIFNFFRFHKNTSDKNNHGFKCVLKFCMSCHKSPFLS